MRTSPMTAEDLIATMEANNRDTTKLIKRLSAYCANITGTDPFWHTRTTELTELVKQKGAPTIFLHAVLCR